MKKGYKRYILTLSVLVVLTVILTGQFVLAAKPGKFDNADFFAPDYNNGAIETVNIGNSRNFNYNCHCADKPGTTACGGYMRLQMDSGSGFANEKSTACNIGELQTCSSNYVKTFSTLGVYSFRIFCDENTGTDFTQPSNEYVTVTVLESCTNGETRLCPLQQGVCEGLFETCSSGSWSGCDYALIPGYESNEMTCDGFDNDCNGLVDDVDADNDGFGICAGARALNNELLLTGQDNPGKLDFLSYNQMTSAYDLLWNFNDLAITDDNCGGEAGDVNHDGLVDFVLSRKDDALTQLEVWTYNPVARQWFKLWRGGISLANGGIGDIADLDGDGKNEILVTSGNGAYTGAYVFETDVIGGTEFTSTKIFGDDYCLYLAAAADMNGNGMAEIITQCRDEDIKIWEWNGAEYAHVQDVPMPPQRTGGGVEIMDDIECGDVDRDGVNECVFCGNSGTSSVIDYTNVNGTPFYFRAYDAPVVSQETYLTQACSVGDVTNDGWDDWFDVSEDGVRVFSYNGNNFYHVWTGTHYGLTAGIGCSAIGDSDNDGRGEMMVPVGGLYNTLMLWESDDVGASSFENTFTFNNAYSTIVTDLDSDAGAIDCNDNMAETHPGAVDICGNGIDEDCDGNDLACVCVDADGDGYNGYDANSCPAGTDCNDNNFFVNPDVLEECGDGIDNNCNNQIDEGCGPVCGDGYCDGLAYGENCNTCSADCWSGPKGACCGDGKCDTRKGESAAVCPVDC